LFAPAYEKAFYKAAKTYAAGDLHGAIVLFRTSAEEDRSDRAVSDDLFAGLLLVQAGDNAAAIPFLEKVVGSNHELPDELMAKYLEEAAIQLRVTSNVSVTLPFGSLAAALVLADCYRDRGRSEEAIGLLPAATRHRSRSRRHPRPLFDAAHGAQLRRSRRTERWHCQ
jgi:tetratricopeptide (TPR) repeat protein